MFLFLSLLVLLFLYHSNNLLLSLLVLEMFGFLVLYCVASNLSSVLEGDYLVLVLFAIFVIEGVIALSGLILLVSFTGSDYVSSSSLARL